LHTHYFDKVNCIWLIRQPDKFIESGVHIIFLAYVANIVYLMKYDAQVYALACFYKLG